MLHKRDSQFHKWLILSAGLLLVVSLLSTGAVSAIVPTPSGTPAPTPLPSPTPIPSLPVGLDHLVLTPDAASIATSTLLPYVAEGFAADNTDLGDVTWATVFTITAPGVCVLNACGADTLNDYTVTGTVSGTVVGTTILHVAFLGATPSPSSTPLPTPVIGPSGTPGSSPTPGPSGTPVFSPTPGPTLTPTPSGTPGFSPTPGPSLIPSPSSTPGASPTPAPVPPSAPTNVVAAAGDSQASVSWTAPASDGGSALSGYTITSSGGQSQSVDGSTTTTVVSGLTDGTGYTFTVTAANLAGPSVVSAPSAAVTPLAGDQAATTVVPPLTTGSATTDLTGTGPTSTTPLTTSVTVPATAGGGSVAIVLSTPPVGPSPVAGYQVLGQQINITSTATTSATNPLSIVFTLDESAIRLQYGLGPNDPLPSADSVSITRTEGGVATLVAPCTNLGGGGVAIAPDPCVASRQYISLNGNNDLQVTVLTGSASLWNTLIKPVAVKVTNAGYSPFLVTVNQGTVVQWTFAGSRLHTVTDLLALGTSRAPWFSSAALLTGTYGHVFQAAGTYLYRSTKDNILFLGAVTVPLKVSPSAGTSATPFTITWSSAPISGYVFDVQTRFEKAGTTKWTVWKAWQTGASAASMSFLPTLGAGSYDFVSRVRNASTGAVSGWSAEATVTVH
jgi:plastocyanin